MNGDPDEIQKLLDAARLKYVARLADQLQTCATLADDAAAGDEDARSELKALAHRIRGTAGSYGLTSISKNLAEVEDAIDGEDVSWDDVRAALSRARSA